MAKQKKQEPISETLTCPLSNKKRILGLDLSLTGTGWCLWGCEYQHDEGLIDTDKMLGLARMDHILSSIMEKLETHPTDQGPGNTLVVMEDFSFGSKGSSLFQIAGLGYIVRYRLWSQGINFILVPPTVLKKFVTGTGNSDKSVMLKETYKRWGADINDDNICDAYGLARIGRALLEWDKDLVGFQKDALKQLSK